MSDRERAARHRAKRKVIEADGRTAAITLHFTPDEQAEFATHVAGGSPEWPDHASLADVMRHELRLCTVCAKEVALERERPDNDPDVKRLSDEWEALTHACASTTCNCPRLPWTPDGRDWRQCAATGGQDRWCAGRAGGLETPA